MEEIRTRIAPSPTGYFHLGNARAALFSYLYAKKYGGKFILRIEDTDRERSKEEYELDLINALSWLGLAWDEGPETDGLYGPYRQSERFEVYKRFTQQLLADKKAYYCYCTQGELEEERRKQEEEKKPPKYSGKCRNLTTQQVEEFKKEGRVPSVRFKVEEGKKISWKDLVHGNMEFDSSLIGDFVIVKPNGDPIFLLSNLIDDAEMKISHVIRGDDHISNTPKQLMLADALNLPISEYGHLPLILNPDRSKLSKRKNPTSVTKDFKDQGYLPEAMINFMAFLGWSPSLSADGDRQFFSLEELIDEFDLNEVGKSPAIFDIEKLNFFNGYYIRKLPLGELAKRCFPYLERAGIVKKEHEFVLNAIAQVQERMKKLSEVVELTEFFFKKPEYPAELLVPKKSEKTEVIKGLEESYRVLEEESDFTRDSLEQLLRALITKLNVSAGDILWPIRVALTGKPASPGAFEMLSVLGKEESLARIKKAIEMLK